MKLVLIRVTDTSVITELAYDIEDCITRYAIVKIGSFTYFMMKVNEEDFDYVNERLEEHGLVNMQAVRMRLIHFDIGMHFNVAGYEYDAEYDTNGNLIASFVFCPQLGEKKFRVPVYLIKGIAA